jgi:2-polyprenyl-3-methyl-5-hydroxy-6-metoxy-1,4-benzoquinol methylase
VTSAEVFNRALYDEFWDACPDFSKYNPGALHRRRVIGELIRSVKFDSLLDVGCGDAQLLMWVRSYAPKTAELWGADLSPETVDTNTKKHPFAHFEVLNLEEKRIDRTFDLVICTEVVEHLEKRDEAVKHLAEMVAPGGHLIVTCPTGKVHATERHFGHVAHPHPDQLSSMIAAAGLEVVSLQNWGFPLYSALKTATNVNPDWALKNFAAGKYTASARLVSKALYWANFLNLPSSPWGCQLFALARRPV